MKRKVFNLLLFGFTTIIISVGAWLVYGRLNERLMNRNDDLARQRAPLFFQTIETYLVEHRGEFPRRREDLDALTSFKGESPFCGDKKDGYIYDCAFGIQEYGIHVYPIKKNQTGRVVFSRSKSNAIYVEHPPESRNRKMIKQSSRGYLMETQDDYKKTLLPGSQ